MRGTELYYSNPSKQAKSRCDPRVDGNGSPDARRGLQRKKLGAVQMHQLSQMNITRFDHQKVRGEDSGTDTCRSDWYHIGEAFQTMQKKSETDSSMVIVVVSSTTRLVI